MGSYPYAVYAIYSAPLSQLLVSLVLVGFSYPLLFFGKFGTKIYLKCKINLNNLLNYRIHEKI